MLAKSIKKIIYVQLAKRTGTNTWGDWIDITEYFQERLGSIDINLVDNTLQGQLRQESCTFSFNNTTGQFNPEGDDNSYWDGTSTFVYHLRIRYYEFNGENYSFPWIGKLAEKWMSKFK